MNKKMFYNVSSGEDEKFHFFLFPACAIVKANISMLCVVVVVVHPFILPELTIFNCQLTIKKILS